MVAAVFPNNGDDVVGSALPNRDDDVAAVLPKPDDVAVVAEFPNNDDDVVAVFPPKIEPAEALLSPKTDDVPEPKPDVPMVTAADPPKIDVDVVVDCPPNMDDVDVARPVNKDAEVVGPVVDEAGAVFPRVAKEGILDDPRAASPPPKSGAEVVCAVVAVVDAWPNPPVLVVVTGFPNKPSKIEGLLGTLLEVAAVESGCAGVTAIASADVSTMVTALVAGTDEISAFSAVELVAVTLEMFESVSWSVPLFESVVINDEPAAEETTAES